MAALVAIDMPGGPLFVDALLRVWDNGDAVFPVDRRLPAPARRALFTSLAPDRLVDVDGAHDLPTPSDIDGARAPRQPIEPGDALVVATSGSTGVPKGVVLTHAAVRASALATSARLAIGPHDRWLACLPLSHMGGLSVVTRALVTGTPLEVHDGFAAGAVERAARLGASVVSLVATAMAHVDASLFRVIVLGGSRPPADRPANAVTTYGMTETGSGVVYDGRPLDGVEVRIDSGGEIHLRGPMLMRCYRGVDDVTNPVDVDGWLATGDLGEWLPDGRLHVIGRRGDLIITGGENVWPDEVEASLRDHPLVADVAVTGVDDREWGQRVTAWVVPRTPPPTLAQLREHVTSRLPAFMAPREVHLVDAIPRTGLGKIARHMLPRSVGPPHG